ncbi:SDR family NAD(P)-dependent oxidoreductase [Polynucleobacter sp. AP-Sving-400A-A2]|uniref:SDR family NAD(P)-dependent oxidoreductase n=1 Tax=Polynucleobacter sp. AP-Sving-400A-A2 TaxID=2081049 RepID=UPI001BFD71A9|nr:SDR family oxidoreductase [Polynucleobacter sp. AP-Sving-400A-A2]QWE14856.1 SDR family oxidoreductase [Polynucleobacter sp. AP-Sving-400A-A2]
MSLIKFTLVTGATSGIGREVIHRLQDDSRLIIHGRDLQKLQNIQSELKRPDDHLIWNHDLVNTVNVEQSISDLLTLNNITVDKFVHSAGIMQLKPLKMLNHLDFSEIFNINVVSAALIVKSLASQKVNSSNLRSAVFISSNLSGSGAKALSSYGASKSALDGLMACLSVELAPKVRINSVLPGAIYTAMTSSILGDEDKKNRMEAAYPLGLGLTTDIADTVAFLLSDKSRWITGQKVVVDGGRSINLTG